MSRNRKKKESLVYQVKKNLDSKLAIEESKSKDKSLESFRLSEKKKCNRKAHLTFQERVTIHKIYSWKTYRDYLHNCCVFVKWCKNNHNCKTLEECRPYVNEWIASISLYSAPTQKAYVCSVAKLYDCCSTNFNPTPIRHRKDITEAVMKLNVIRIFL